MVQMSKGRLTIKYIRVAVFRRPCFLGVLHPPWSCNLSTSSSLGFPDLEEKELIETSHLGFTNLGYLILYTLFSYWSLYLFSSTVRGSFSDSGWARHGSESNGIFYESFLLLHSVSRTSIFFPLGSWSIHCQVPEHPNNRKHGFHLNEWALYSTSKWLVTLAMFVPLHYCISCEATVADQRFCRVCGYYSPLTAFRIPSSILYTIQEGWRLWDGANS